MIRKRIAAISLTVALSASYILAPSVALADTASLQAQLDAANATLNELYSKAEELSEQVNQTQADLDSTNAEIETKQEELSEAQDVLADRVASNYKTGGVSLVTIIFQSSNFDELVSRIYYANKVSASDAEAISTVKEIQAELDTKKGEQEQLLADQQTQQAELDASVAESESYVSSLSSELQEAIAAEQAAAQAAAEAAAAEAAQNASNNGGNYVDNTDNPADNTANNNNNNNNSNSNNSSNNNSNSNNNGSYSGGSLSSSQRNAIVSAAWAKVGCSYVYGATGPNSYDCSGFVQYCYRAAGISLPRSSYDQGACGTRTSNPQAGDIICWGGHVGIYIGGGMMIDAGNPSTGVSYRAIYGSPWYVTL